MRVGPSPGTSSSTERGHLLVAQLAVVGDGEAVGLVAHLLEQVERLGVARDAHRLRRPGHVDLLEPLGEAGHRDVLEPELLEHAHRDAELALAAVDEHRLGGYANRLPAARALVALLRGSGGTGG